jgi:hypothetical protein
LNLKNFNLPFDGKLRSDNRWIKRLVAEARISELQAQMASEQEEIESSSRNIY